MKLVKLINFIYCGNLKEKRRQYVSHHNHPDDKNRDHHFGYPAEHGLFKDDVRNPQDLATGGFQSLDILEICFPQELVFSSFPFA
jgi:hypothetical protein